MTIDKPSRGLNRKGSKRRMKNEHCVGEAWAEKARVRLMMIARWRATPNLSRLTEVPRLDLC